MNTSALVVARRAHFAFAAAARPAFIGAGARVLAVRRYASDPSKNPAPPPLGPAPLDQSSGTTGSTPPNPETKGSSTPLLLGAVVAGTAVGYYYYYSRRSVGQEEDVKLKARELEHAARVQTQQKIDEGREKYDKAKAEGRERADSAQSYVHSTYNDAADRARNVAAEAQAKLDSYRNNAALSLERSKEATEKAAHDAKAYADEKAQQARGSWWSWFGWGKSKSEDTKEAAASQAARAAKDVKETAADAEKSAQKRA